MEEIKVYDPKSNAVFTEKVYGARALQRAYSNFFLNKVISSSTIQKAVSKLVAVQKKSSLSKKSVSDFVKAYDINLNDFEVPLGGYQSFNEFFIRKKKNIKFPEGKTLGSPCDARLSIARISNSTPALKIKGRDVLLPDFLGPLRDRCPKDGWAMTFRLCPVDYHRFHFVDAGPIEETQKLGTTLHSVNPWALQSAPQIFEWNERQLSIQNGETFGEIIYVEVGAMCVGAIHQTYDRKKSIQRGQEKGYFDFGGSTLVLIVSDIFAPDERILNTNEKGLEWMTRVGDSLGRVGAR